MSAPSNLTTEEIQAAMAAHQRELSRRCVTLVDALDTSEIQALADKVQSIGPLLPATDPRVGLFQSQGTLLTALAQQIDALKLELHAQLEG